MSRILLGEGVFVTGRMFPPQGTEELWTMKGEAPGSPQPDAEFMHAVYACSKNNISLESWL